MHAQRGVIAIMLAIMLVLWMAFFALVIDLSRVYNRKVELQEFADILALTAAAKLNGTKDGIDGAIEAARLAALSLKYDYKKTTIPWNDSAITFGTSQTTTDWRDAEPAKTVAASIAYVKVDTSRLTAGVGVGTVDTLFAKLIPGGPTSVTPAITAIAGRSTVKVTPLAICAMSPVAAAARSINNELVQYGFRRGVGYNLMQLNPTGTTPLNFVVNPIDAPGKLGDSDNTDPSVLSPFICSGTMPMRALVGTQVSVAPGIPLGSLFEQLNSRFDSYNGSCVARSAPPDTNVREFTVPGGVTWMKVAPTVQTAASHSPGNRLQTIADPDSLVAGAVGVLWSFAKPVAYSASEPASGYTGIDKSLWSSLYSGAEPKTTGASAYPDSTPYLAAAFFRAPRRMNGYGVEHRRVLNIPLLECPVESGTMVQAKVLAIARFFMTVPATGSAISAEFAGIASESTLGGSVELYK